MNFGSVKVAFTEWGDPVNPIMVCVGGVANTAMRFNYLSADLEQRFRVVNMDWVGRGRSGWMADEGDYSLATYVEQLRQLIDHLGGCERILKTPLPRVYAIEIRRFIALFLVSMTFALISKGLGRKPAHCESRGTATTPHGGDHVSRCRRRTDIAADLRVLRTPEHARRVPGP